ncbi:MAG: hypothetical protein ACFFA3_10550 [Promethearchaeota archaeon]
MSSKSKLITAIVLLAVGAGLVPTGLVTNDYLRDLVSDGVPEAMIKIKADAVPALEEQIPVLGLPDVLKGVFDAASAGVEPLLKLKSTPGALLGLKAEIEAKIPDIIDFGTAAQLVNLSIYWLNLTYGFDAGTNVFFNDPTFVDPYTGIPGVSNITGVAQNYTLTARTNLLDSIFYDAYITPYYFHGIITDTTYGTGAKEIYDIFYYIAYLGGDGYTNAVIPGHYNVTIAQVGNTFDYIWTLITYAVPSAFQYNYGITRAEAIATGFYRQWANATFFPDGIDIGLFIGTSELKGFEAGIPAPTNISIATCMNLWNSSLPLSFTNDSGIETWIAAGLGDPTAQGTLIGTFGLSPTQLTMILTWLSNFIDNVTPALVLDATGQTVSQLAILAFYEQWANGTIFGEVILPGGFLGEVDPSFAGAPYFEVGLPTASGLSLAECIALWDPLSDKTFIYGDSYSSMWLPAMQMDTTAQASIIASFGISTGELTALLNWLGALIGADPATGRAADLIELDYGLTLTQVATIAFYEQWANGTINGEVVLPEGFLSERTPPIYGPPYFEIGLSYVSTLTLTQCFLLWDEDSDYSLVTVKGVNNWYKAKEGNAMYTTLQAQNGGLNFIQMSAILEWLPVFRDILVNKLAEDDKNLPMTPYDLGDTLALSLGAGGGALAALGVILLILSRRS